MRLYFLIKRLWVRFTYPISLPEEIVEALGLPVSPPSRFHEFLLELPKFVSSSPKLQKYMQRDEAEDIFYNAFRVEKFADKTLVTYCFPQGCIEFDLQFDNTSRLRRIYLHHKKIVSDRGLEIPLH